METEAVNAYFLKNTKGEGGKEKEQRSTLLPSPSRTHIYFVIIINIFLL